MLGQNVAPVMVASTLGVSQSLISQFMGDRRFAEEVTKIKLQTLQKQTSIDNKWMEVEDKMLDKLIKTIPLITKPMDLLRGLSVANAAKRRGVGGDASMDIHNTQIVQINLPQSMAARFVTNGQNQIVEVQDDEGSRSLITTSPVALDKLAKEVNRDAEALIGTCWEASADPRHLLEQASQRVSESPIAETIGKGLRRSLEAQGKITEADL
ncbi:hypothetical protein D3C72_1530870 [compost metagenome]